MSRLPWITAGSRTTARARVTLRAPSPADRDEFLALMRESRTMHLPWAVPPTTDADYDALLERASRADTEAHLICRSPDGVIVGFANLNHIVRGGLQSAYLGYAVGAPHAAQGYMTEGLELVLARAFDELGLHRVEANIQPGNGRSLALAERCGFRREGYSPRYLRINGAWRDHERWALLAEDWRLHLKSR
ncbi:MAG TPA: GNAT family protein [Solirubrobacteraceae bacterium]|nr:GNAT family protein [Solirubrobacteraceae bacterium]